MNVPVIVFDFDKTLTEKDTLFGFYRLVSKSRLRFLLKLPVFYMVAVATKLGLLSNTSLKRVGVKLFLDGQEKKRLENIGKQYASQIELNRIYREDLLKRPPENVLIISASYEEYLKPLFPDHKVVGSRLDYNKENKVNGMLVNMHGTTKQQWLLKNGIREVDLLYTDSFSDKPLMDLAKRVILVENSQKRELTNQVFD